MLLASGCDSEHQPLPMPDDPTGLHDRLVVEFQLAVDRTTSQVKTRAGAPLATDNESWDDPYPTTDASEFDVTLDSLNPVLYAVKDDGSLDLESANIAGTVSIVTKQRSETSGRVVYNITGILQTTLTAEELRAGNFRLAIFANAYPSDPAAAGSLSFNYYGTPLSTTPVAFPAIPMWGVAKADLSDIEMGQLKHLADVDLLRAMAQVRMRVSDELFAVKDDEHPDGREVRLVSMSLNRMNSSGYVVPGDWNTLTSTNKLLFTNTLNELSSPLLGGFTVTADPDAELAEGEVSSEQLLSFYLPEVSNSDDPANELVLTLRYTTDGIEEIRENTVHFSRYTADGTYDESAEKCDILRNHIYEYKITGVGTAYTPELEVCIKQWRYEKFNGELGSDSEWHQ